MLQSSMPTPISQLRRVLFALTASVGSMALTLLVLEGVSRLVLPASPVIVISDTSNAPTEGPRVERRDPEKIEVADVSTLFYRMKDRGTRLRPNTDAFLPKFGYEGNVHVRSNSLGVRHEELPPKGLDEFRILVLGDSIVFGAELNEPKTFVALMEKAFENRWKRVRVINAAIPSSNTRDQFYRYLELREAVRADLVLIGMYLNDAQESTYFRVWPLTDPYRRSRLLSWIALKAQLVARFGEMRVRGGELNGPEHEAFWTRFAAGRTFPPSMGIPYGPRTRDEMDAIFYNARNDFGLSLEPESWERIASYVSAIRDQAAQDRTKLRIALFPVRWQVEANFLEERPQQYFREMCAELSVGCRDLLPAMRRWHAEGKQIHYDGCHLVKTGHAEVARDLVAWLDRLGDLPRRSF
jgi:lysophospholipase L1-like esterase